MAASGVHLRVLCLPLLIRLAVPSRAMDGETEARDLAGLWMSATSPRRPRAGASDLKPASLCRANPAPRWAFQALAAAFPAKVPAQERKVVVAVQTKWRAVEFHLIRGQAAQAAAQVVIRPCLELL